MHRAVSGSARSGRVAAAGLCLVLRKAPRTGFISQHRGQSESLPGEALQFDEQLQEQGPGPHRPVGGTRLWLCVCGCGCVCVCVYIELCKKNI